MSPSNYLSAIGQRHPYAADVKMSFVRIIQRKVNGRGENSNGKHFARHYTPCRVSLQRCRGSRLSAITVRERYLVPSQARKEANIISSSRNEDLAEKVFYLDELLRRVKVEEGMIIGDEEMVVDRWKRYFAGLYVGEREELGSRQARECLGEGIEEIGLEEMVRELIKRKNGRSPGVCNIQVELLKAGGMSLVKWMQRVFNMVMKPGRAPKDWCHSGLQEGLQTDMQQL